MSKVILITGASSGIGAACARHAVEAGHKVTLAARSLDKLEELVSELGADNALAVECDVTDPASQKAAFEATADKFGKIDVVFANAGMGLPSSSKPGTAHGDIEAFKDMIMVNNFAVTITAQLAAPYLEETKGHLLLTGSRAGYTPIPGSVYGATKWFIRGYADNLAQEYGPKGIHVTNLNPGMVDTPFFDEPKPHALRDTDIANAFIYAISQPPHVSIPSLNIYPMPKEE